MADRQTSLLTNSQREFLKEGGDGASARMARKRIRERAHEALFDFPLLLSGLGENDLKKIFENRDTESKYDRDKALSSALAFLYLGITNTAEQSDLAKDHFEDMVAKGVRQAYNRQEVSVLDIDVDIDITVGEPFEKLKERDELGRFELLQLNAGELSGKELKQLMEAVLRSDNPDAGLGAFPELPTHSTNVPDGVETLEDLADSEGLEIVEEEGETDEDDGDSDDSGIYDPTDEFED